MKEKFKTMFPPQELDNLGNNTHETNGIYV